MSGRCVSIFEASVKTIVRRAFTERGQSSDEIESHFKKIGNSFQSVERTKAQLIGLFGLDLGQEKLWDSLSASFKKRHPVTHNLGVVDRKYLQRGQEAEREGHEVHLAASEIHGLLMQVQEAVALIHARSLNPPHRDL